MCVPKNKACPILSRPVFAALSGGSGSVNWQSLFRNLELLGRRLGWEGLTDGIGQHGHTADEHACDAIWQKIFTSTASSSAAGDTETACFYVSTFMFLRHLSEYWKTSHKNCFVVEGFAEHMQVKNPGSI